MDQMNKDTETPIFDITKKCLESFDLVLANYDESILEHRIVPKYSIRNRSPYNFLCLQNRFLFWIDESGALSPSGSSLDAKVKDIAEVPNFLVYFLGNILQELSYIVNPPGDTSTLADRTPSNIEDQPAFLKKWGEVCEGIESCLNHLEYVAMTVWRMTPRRLNHVFTTSSSDEDIAFCREIKLLVRYRFPAARKALCEQLGESITMRRQMLMQTECLGGRTFRRIPKSEPSAEKHRNTPREPNTAIIRQTKNKLEHRPSVSVNEITNTSRLDPQALVLRNLHLPKPKTPTTAISTISTTQEDYFAYPPVPAPTPGETRIRCSFCFMRLECKGSEKETNDLWKRHIDEHIEPYTCIFPKCSNGMVFFARRHEWKAHMESVHSKDWLRKVHTRVWCCTIDHDIPETFETELQWKEHMNTLKLHPSKQAIPTQDQLKALCLRVQKNVTRDQFVCPFCEKIPEKIRPLVENGNGEPKDMYDFVVDHVANHLKSLALLAVPSLPDPNQDAPVVAGPSEIMEKSTNRIVSENSGPQLPNGIDMEENCARPTARSKHDSDDDRSWIMLDETQSWDKKHFDYVQSKEPPKSSDENWIELGSTCESENHGSSQSTHEMDTVLGNSQKVKEQNCRNTVWRAFTSDKVYCTDPDGTVFHGAPMFTTRPYPNGPFELGTLVEDLTQCYPMNEERKNPVPIPEDQRFSDVKEDVSVSQGSILGKVLDHRIGGDAGRKGQKRDGDVYSIQKLETIQFFPQKRYIEKCLQLPDAKEYIRMGRYEYPVYMITGLKIAWGAIISLERGRDFDGKAGTSVKVSGGIADVDVKGGRTGVSGEPEMAASFEEPADLVLAIQVRKIYQRHPALVDQSALAGKTVRRGAILMDMDQPETEDLDEYIEFTIADIDNDELGGFVTWTGPNSSGQDESWLLPSDI